MRIPGVRNADDDQLALRMRQRLSREVNQRQLDGGHWNLSALFIGASMTIKCPVCKTKRDDGDPVIRCEKAGEVRVCLTCGAGYKIFQGSRRTEQATL
jgi:hypothetical protein